MNISWHKIGMTAGICVVMASRTLSHAADAPEKTIYAHYMGCYPVASAATAHHRAVDAHTIRHDGNKQFDAIGDRWRNWPLVPDGMRLSPEESADLEIRRALRGGIDGFAIDAWAGGDGAKQVLDALFKVAETKNYPFNLTICLDPAILDNNGAAEAIKHLLDKHGSSPKLARRNGKPLIFGYMSSFIGFRHGAEVLKQQPECAEADAKALTQNPKLRLEPAGWQIMADGLLQIQKQVGSDLFMHYCMGAFFHRMPNQTWSQDNLVRAAGFMAARFGAVGEFLGGGPTHDRMAAAVKSAGAEWSEPMYFQYENIGWGGNHIGKGVDILRDRWQHARDNGSTLIQFVTWNDYTENTCLAPAYETRYTILDLNAHFVQWWKTGKEPVPDHDKVYLLYRKYPHGAKIFPFNPKQPDADPVLEVLTILTKPATVHLPGRGAEWEAPAGLSWKQFPATPGPVVAELVRSNWLFLPRVELHLESPEPITDRPFREQNGTTCSSTEFTRHWQADFGDAPPLLRGEYADDDADGLPNWFEMYWFGKFLDYSTAAVADPNADPDGDGKTNIQEHLDQTDPTRPPMAYSELPSDGLLAWYRADKGVIADEKGQITEWQDQSGNGLHLAATVDAHKPRRVEKQWGDLPAVELDGAQNSMLRQLPDKEHASMTVVAVFAAKAEEQLSGPQKGANNRLVSIPTSSKPDYEGGIAIGVSAIYYPSGGVAVAKREFASGERPTFIGVGTMVIGKQPNYRSWNVKGKVAEILVYSPALSEKDVQRVVSILKARYNL